MTPKVEKALAEQRLAQIQLAVDRLEARMYPVRNDKKRTKEGDDLMSTDIDVLVDFVKLIGDLDPPLEE